MDTPVLERRTKARTQAAAKKLTPLQALLLGCFVLLLLAFAALSLWFGGRSAMVSARTLEDRWLVGTWRNGTGPEMSPARWQATQQDLLDGLQLGPDNAELHGDLGFLHATRAVAMGVPEPDTAEYAAQQALFTEALVHYRAATVLRPTFPYAWAYLALTKYLLWQPDAEMWHAFDKALAHGVNEAGVQHTLARIAFANWADAGPQRQAAIVQMVATAQAEEKLKLLKTAEQYEVVLP